MFYQIYRLLVYVLLPFILLAQWIKGFKNPEYRNHWNERLGFGENPDAEYDIWIHAVSVGETRAILPLVKRLSKDNTLLITVTTPTGRETAENLFGDCAHIRYLPLDVGFCVRRFLKNASPQQAVIVETEVWPNLIKKTKSLDIPLSYINVRLSGRSFKKYYRFKSFSQDIFNEIDVIAAQGKLDADRLKGLGVDSDKIVITGSLKFDMPLPDNVHQRAEEFVNAMQWKRTVWTCGSTRDGEEQLLLHCYSMLKKYYPELLMIIVPRHPERFDEVANFIEEAGFNIVRHSQSEKSISIDTDIYLGDTLGDLNMFYAASDIAFVGGSLVPLGGQNILEPCAFGVPVLFGPHMFNFEQISKFVVKSGAGKCVKDVKKLQGVMDKLLSSESRRQKMSQQGLDLMQKHKGALEKVLKILENSQY